MTGRRMKSGCVPEYRKEGSVRMEQIVKAVIIGILSVVIAVLNEDKGD